MAVPGAPGTLLSLVMRALQFAFATASVVTMMIAPRLLGYSDNWGLAIAMLEIFWSLGFGCYHVYVLITGGGRPGRTALAIRLIIDGFIAGLALATTIMSAVITALFIRDGTPCSTIRIECNRAIISIIFAFIAWLFEAISLLIIFRLWHSL